jgi:hypothetical protein
LLFGAAWLSQIAGSILSGSLPSELAEAGWPMNPVFVLDLGFVLPLAAIGAARLWRPKPGGERIAIPFLIFAALLAQSILLMAASAALSGQTVAVPMLAIFATLVIASSALSARALVVKERNR